MNQAESLSDSDSSTSSWIFVDECAFQNKTEKNKYYLNCSSEPVQELTSQCLNSVEPETDSDGISVISESEKENSSSEEFVLTENVDEITIENVTQHTEKTVEVKDEYYFNKYVIVGWVVIAVMTPLLLNYFSTYIEDLLGRHRDNTAVDLLKPELLVSKLDLNVVIKDNYAQQLKGNEITGSNFQNKQNMIDTKKEIDVNSINCENKIKKGGKHRRKYLIKNEKRDFKEEPSRKKGLMATENKNPDSQVVGFVKKYLQNARTNSPKKIKKYPTENNGKMKKKKNQEKKNYDFKSDDFPKKKSKNDKNEHAKSNKKKNKKEKQKNFRDPVDENFYLKEIKNLRKSLKNKDKNIKELTKQMKMKDKQLKFLEYKILKELNTLKKSERNDEQVLKTVDNENSFEDKINRTSGEWYYKLYKGRSKFRNQQHASDWVFDRAQFRNRKRNMKNNWYWNWMSDREQLRLKRGFWQFTY